MNRISLAGTNVTVQSSNFGSGNEPGEPTGANCVRWFNSVWYSYTAPAAGVVHLSGSTSLSSFILSARGYRGNAVDALTDAPTTLDGGIPMTAGDTIAIQVSSIYYPCGGGAGGSGNFTLNLLFEEPVATSPNDAFSNRIEITAPNYHFDGSIYGATNEPGEPLPVANTRQTLWWKFSPSEDGLLALYVTSPQFSPLLTLYEGTVLNSLTPVTSVVGSLYRLQGGHEYSVQLASDFVPSGSFSLDTRYDSLTNDFFSGSRQMEGTNITVTGNFGVATLEPGEPSPGRTNTVWISWAAPFTGRVLYSMATAPQFQFVSAYTGFAVTNLQPVAVVPLVNRVTSFLAVQGTVYHFQISGDDYYDYNFSLSLLPFGPGSNDNFANATIIKGRNFTTAAASVGEATLELGEPAHLGGSPAKSLWWKWQAPQHGTFTMYSSGSLVPNLVLAIYRGNSVDALQLVAKGTNSVSFPVTGGDYYYVAGVVPANAIGDVAIYGQGSVSTTPRAVPGNLLKEPSWEGTGILSAQYWHASGSLGGYVNEGGGVDGTTWPVLSGGTKIWQDFATVPGHSHLIRFAYAVGGNLSGCCGDARVKVLWGTNELGISEIPAAESGFWHWGYFTAVATATNSRITFENLARNVEMDAFSVVSLTDPPAIVTQPASISTFSGGSAAFVFGVTGSEPLKFQWYFGNSPLANQTNRLLQLNAVTSQQAGSYFAITTNAFGAVTSAPASLTVNAATDATILVQPYGDLVPVGGYYNFSVAAAGTPPLTYQWYFNDEAVAAATNSNLSITNVQLAHAGTYKVIVQGPDSAVVSLPAVLAVTEIIGGGALLNFRNKWFGSGTNTEAPVFDVEGVTRLTGTNFVAQLYAGDSLEMLRAAGEPSSFQDGFLAGFFVSRIITLPTIAPGSNAVAQVRAWERSMGSSYEEARARGGKFGKSIILTIPTGGGLIPPKNLTGLQNFSLQTGLPALTVGQITLQERQPGNVVLWSHRGEVGFRYVIEKKLRDENWMPYLVITNTTPTVTFSDKANSGASVVFYRSRILD